MCFEGMPWLPALPLWGTEGKAGGSVSLLCIVRPRRGLQVACTLFDQALFWRRAEHTRVYLRDRALGQGEARHQRGAASSVTLVWVLCYHVWLRALGGKGPAASGGCRTLEAGEQLSAEAEAGSTLVL